MFLRTPLILANLVVLALEALAFLNVRSSSLSFSMLALMVPLSPSLIFWLIFFYTINDKILIFIIFNIFFVMGRIFKTGRVVVLTQGRFAGKKALVIKSYEEGNKKHRFPHLLVAGIARNPQRVKRAINKKKFIKKTGVKPFVKYVNQGHVMPTRFLVNDFDFKDVKDENLKNKEAKISLKKSIRKQFSDSYRTMPNPKQSEKAGHIRFFFNRLRF